MLIIENEIDVDVVKSLSEDAKTQFDIISKAFTKDEITRVVENLSKSDPHLAIAIGAINEDVELNEFMVKHVSSKGEISKTQDRKTREKNAFQTTGLSKAKRRQIARKATKTKKANPSGEKHRVKSFKKALNKRKQLNMD